VRGRAHRRKCSRQAQKMRTAPMQGHAWMRGRVHHRKCFRQLYLFIRQLCLFIQQRPRRQGLCLIRQMCLSVCSQCLFTTPLPQLRKKENKFHSLAIDDQWIRAPNSGPLCLLFVNQVCPPLIFVCVRCVCCVFVCVPAGRALGLSSRDRYVCAYAFVYVSMCVYECMRMHIHFVYVSICVSVCMRMHIHYVQISRPIIFAM
jgi:hypothetical protein